MWNGDLDRQMAKAISQMIVGMIDVLINNNQLLEDMCIYNHGILEVSTSRSTTVQAVATVATTTLP